MTPEESDRAFVQAALAARALTREQLGALDAQRRALAAQGQPVTLAALAVHVRLLTKEQLAALARTASARLAPPAEETCPSCGKPLPPEARGKKTCLACSTPRPAPAVLERDDVRAANSPNRCPFCHEDVAPEDEWVACKSCLARHHRDCWTESKACASCGEAAFVAREEPARRSRSFGQLAAALGLLLVALGVGAALVVRAQRLAAEARARAEAEARKARCEEILSRAEGEHKVEHYAAVIELANEALALDPRSEKALYWRGIAHQGMNETKLAIADYTAALELAPDNQPCRTNRAHLRIDLNDLDGGTQDAENVIAHYPQYGVGFFERGRAKEARGDYRGALEDFDQAAKDPKCWVAYFGRGNEKVRLGDPMGAVDDYAKFLENAPPGPIADKIRKQATLICNQHARDDLYKTGKFREAKEVLDRGLQVDKNSTELLHTRSVVLMELHDFAAARADLDHLIEMNPLDDMAYMNRGTCRNFLEDLTGALDDSTKAIELNPDLMAAVADRAKTLMMLKRPKEALKDMDRLVKKDPKYAEGYYMRGLVKKELRNYEGALADFTRALDMAPTAIEALWNQALMFQALQRPKPAIEALTKVLARDPKRKGAHMNRAYCLMTLNEFDRALEDMNAELAGDGEDLEHPRNVFYLAQRAWCRANLEDEKGAFADLDRALELKAGDPDTINQRGRVYCLLEKHDKAIAEWTGLVKRFPRADEGFYHRGTCYVHVEKYAEAVVDFTRAIEINSKLPAYWKSRGDARRRMGKLDLADKDFDGALALDPDDIESHTNRAWLRVQLGNKAGAREDLLRALELDTEHLKTEGIKKLLEECDKK